ncbi:hypothetical protein GH714_018430 [Hevea brasiliensis]|uniref:ubiquitinyl hydrolase 1 n=1 Tax=Hevea brasiliensis TaxID=3981 RepID=A0A6A6K5H1_HEVBR|nr:hypothetical protein GH714_018430 [Hevea brasiliensis]
MLYENFFSNEDERIRANDEFVNFSLKSGPFADPDSIRSMYVTDPRKWWACFGSNAHLLQRLAFKVLGQPTYSSCCERNWSIYSFIHSCRRNKLTSKRAEDLVFIHNNLRLLSRNSSQYYDEKTKLWDVGGDQFGSTLLCVPFREQLLEYYATNKNTGDAEENLLTCLADLFTQDAHEFLNFLLNELVDILEKEAQAAKSDPETSSPPEKIANGPNNAQANGVSKEPLVTWVHKNFQGILTNETRCLQCETVTARDETFFDLSLDIEQNSSITSCLKNFSSTETLNAEDKFFCDKCCSLQEAQKRMKIKKPPHILVIHLKRFKYIEQLGRYKKLSYRVVFPLELKLSNTMEDADIEYSLFAVVVHVGSGPNHGHYVSLVKSHNHWLFLMTKMWR